MQGCTWRTLSRVLPWSIVASSMRSYDFIRQRHRSQFVELCFVPRLFGSFTHRGSSSHRSGDSRGRRFIHGPRSRREEGRFVAAQCRQCIWRTCWCSPSSCLSVAFGFRPSFWTWSFHVRHTSSFDVCASEFRPPRTNSRQEHVVCLLFFPLACGRTSSRLQV